MRLLFLLFILIISEIAVAQTSQSVGFAFKAGAPYSKVSGLNGYQPDLERSFGINLWSPGLYFEHRVNDWSFQVGGWYMNQKIKFKDETVVNYGTADIFGENIKFTTTMKFIQVELGARKTFSWNQKVLPFIGLYSTGSFFNTSPLNFSATGQGGWGNANGIYEISNTFPSSFNMGVRPEIGFTLVSQKGREISFSYTYHFGFNNIVEGTYTARTNNNTVLSQNKFVSSGNYTGITMKYNITLRKENEDQRQERLLAKKDKHSREKETIAKNTNNELTKFKKGKPVEHKGREIKVQKEITISSPTIDLFVWDSGAKEDGDSISIYVNDELVLQNHGLSQQKDTITISLKPNQPNYVIIYAHNEGTEPPNTASVGYILPSGGENIFKVYSKVDQSGAIIIKYKP